MSEGRRCSACGSDQVEKLFLVWVDANTLETLDDYGPADELGTFWCRTCQTNPEHIDGEPLHGEARRHAVADRVCKACGANCNDPDWGSCHECGNPIEIPPNIELGG